MSVLHSSFRAFSALLLLVGVMLGGALDAAACEPEMDTTSFVAAHAGEQDQGAPDQGDADHDGICAHGHCHHGAQNLAQSYDVARVIFTSVAPAAVRQASLEPSEASTPIRPPRA